MLLAVIGILVMIGTLMVCLKPLILEQKENFKAYAKGYLIGICILVLTLFTPNPISSWIFILGGVLILIALVVNFRLYRELMKVGEAMESNKMFELSQNEKLSTKAQFAILNHSLNSLNNKDAKNAVINLAKSEHCDPAVLKMIAMQADLPLPIEIASNPSSEPFCLEIVTATSSYSEELVLALAKNDNSNIKSFINMINTAYVSKASLIANEGKNVESFDIILKEMRILDPSLANVPDRYIIAAYRDAE